MGPKVLGRCERITFRRFRRADLKARLTWPPYVDPFFAHLNYPLSTFVERERWLLTRITNTGKTYLAVEDEGGDLIGEMSLREIDSKTRSSRLGIHLAADKLGQGYGREAIIALLDYYFNVMRFDVIFLDVAAYNTRALRLYESLHFLHIRLFWRSEPRDLPVFTDDAFAWMRRYFRRKGPLLECLYEDMVLTKERYFECLTSTSQTTASREDPD